MRRVPTVQWRRGTAPNVTVRYQPLAGDKLTYLVLGPTAEGRPEQYKLIIGVRITNHESQPIHLNAVRVSFPGTALAPTEMQHVPTRVEPIEPGKSGWWSNSVVNVSKTEQVDNAIYRDMPAPPRVRVELGFAGYDGRIGQTLELAPHVSSVAGGAYLFPFRAADLPLGAYYTTQARHWAPGGARGSQIYAHDIEVRRFDGDDLTNLEEDGKDTRNDDYLVFGIPVRAMADGVVKEVHTGMEENTPPGFPEPTPKPVSGNHVVVTHGTDEIVYAHFQDGSIPAEVVQGANVTAGQVLGICGNTGNSSWPHLHIQCAESGLGLQPLPLRECWVLDPAELDDDRDGPWVRLERQGVPDQLVLIWPATTRPGFYPPGWGEVFQVAVSEKDFERWFHRAWKANYRLEWLDGYEVSGKTFFNALYRWNGDFRDWRAEAHLTSQGYQKVFDEMTGKGFRLTHLTSYRNDGQVNYGCVFEKRSGPAWVAYHGLTYDEHKARLDELERDGFRPVNVSVVSIDGKLSYAGLYDKRSGGAWRLRSRLTREEYQKEWTEQDKVGRKVSYLSAYQHGGSVQLCAIFEEQEAKVSGRHDLSAAEMRQQIRSRLAQGRRTRCLAGYSLGPGGHQFAAIWH